MATFVNQATLSYNGVVTASNVATGELLEVLSADKTAIGGSYSAGDGVTYAVSIVNAGAADLTGLTVTDDLGSYPFGGEELVPLDYAEGSVRYYVNGRLQPAPAVTSGGSLTVDGIDVPAGGNAMILYETIANRYAPPGAGGTITNTATITGAGLSSPVTAEETVTAQTEPVLTISKSLSPAVVTENEPITYTLTVQNYGGAAATGADGAVITDLFDPVLQNLTVTFNGTAWTEAEYSYSEETGLFTTAPGALTVPAAAFEQDAATGVWSTTPGTSVLTVTGTI